MHRLLVSIAALGTLFLSQIVAVAAEREGYHSSLFNGQNLEGWKVSGCDVGVENGVLVLKSGDGFVRSDLTYGDFVLDIDWRAKRTADWDSGIYIRSQLPREGKPWPDRYQVNLAQGQEGNLLGIEGAKSADLTKAGEWNHFRLKAVGNKAELEINGKPAWKASGLANLSGYLGLQSEVDHGGPFEFRNIEVTELDFKPLFNGKDLTGWQGDTHGYSAENGALVCRPDGGGNLYTANQYSDFAVRFDFKLQPGGNNGLGIRAPLKGDAAYVGMEIQILDDSSDQYKNIQPYQHHGSIYGVVPAKTGYLRPVGQWNTEEVICRGPQITVNLNGVTIVDADIEQAGKPHTIDGKDHPGLDRKEGYIGFLGHGARVEFRNIRVKDLGQ